MVGNTPGQAWFSDGNYLGCHTKLGPICICVSYVRVDILVDDVERECSKLITWVNRTLNLLTDSSHPH